MAVEPSVSWVRVTLDCSDAEAMATFYAELFGWEINARDGAGWAQVQDPEGGVGLNFQADERYEPPTWPEEPGRQMKMMHFEVLVDDVETTVAAAVRAGGRVAAYQPPDRDPARLRVLLDPAGHPFCVFAHGE